MNGERLATLELSISKKKWVVNQCKGRKNSKVSNEILKISEQVANIYNREEEKNKLIAV